MAGDPEKQTPGKQTAQQQAKGVNLGWAKGQPQATPTLATYLGDEMAKNVTTLAGDKGAEALLKSYQAADQRDEPARRKEWHNFVREIVNHFNDTGVPEEKSMIEAAAGLDKTTHISDMSALNAEQGMKLALESRDKLRALIGAPDKTQEKANAAELQNKGIRDFMQRTDDILREAYQMHSTHDPDLDPAQINRKKQAKSPSR
jgi:hypothetical protein